MAHRIYADHSATTPVRAEVAEAMRPHLESPGNPSSLHAEGRAARAALGGARRSVAAALGAKPREIVFTSGGSESDNLAILGAARAARARGRHVVTAATEHPAVLRAFDRLRDDGYEVTVLGVDAQGRVDPDAYAAALRPDTTLVSLMLANNEIGTLHPIARFAALARERGVVFHCDAVQAPGRVSVGVDELGADLVSLSAHKMYGPKGVGVLYVRTGTAIAPLVVGGGQESGLRAGTENVSGIVGLARALELAIAELAVESDRLRRLRDGFERAVLSTVPGARVNAAGAERLPSVSSVEFAGVDATALLVRLDLEGAAVSAGSACASGAAEASHVLAAIAGLQARSGGTLRFSFGKRTSEQDVERLQTMLAWTVARARVGESVLGTVASGSSADFSEVRS